MAIMPAAQTTHSPLSAMFVYQKSKSILNKKGTTYE